MISKSVIVFYLQLLADIKLSVIIIEINQLEATINRWNFQDFQQVPFRLTEVIRRAVEDNTIRGIIEMIIPPPRQESPGFSRSLC